MESRLHRCWMLPIASSFRDGLVTEPESVTVEVIEAQRIMRDEDGGRMSVPIGARWPITLPAHGMAAPT